jgi:hypothetical protein
MKTKKYRVTWRNKTRVLSLQEIKAIVAMEGQGDDALWRGYWHKQFLEAERQIAIIEKHSASKLNAEDSKALKVRCMRLEEELRKLKKTSDSSLDL